MDKLPCGNNTEHSPDPKITVMWTSFPAGAEILAKLVEQAQKCNALFP